MLISVGNDDIVTVGFDVSIVILDCGDDNDTLLAESVATAVSIDKPSGTNDNVTCQEPLDCVVVTP